jgi:hypothetical protein
MNYTDPSGLEKEQGWGDWIKDKAGEAAEEWVDAGNEAFGCSENARNDSIASIAYKPSRGGPELVNKGR